MRTPTTLLAVALCCGAGGGVVGTARAVTLRGHLTYAGQPVLATFSTEDFASASVSVLESASGTWTDGTVDLATSTYEIGGLAEGTYALWVVLSPASGQLARGEAPRPGELGGEATGIEIGPSDPGEVPVGLTYAVRFTLPFASTRVWPGSPWQCPRGPAVPPSVTVGWDPVPRAVRYEVRIERRSCSEGLLRSDTLTPTGTSVSIVLGDAPGEEEALVSRLEAFDGDGTLLSRMPWMAYESGIATSIYLHPEASGGRPANSTVGQFVPQVAKVKGVGTSFWTSSLTLTNPTDEDITATLYFTPRNADGITAAKEASVAVPAGGCRGWDDLLGSLFSTSGAGALEVHDATLIVASRTFTSDPAGGTYGQGYMPIRKERTASLAGLDTLRGGGVVKGAFRTNLTLNEVWGESVRVKVELFDADRAELGERIVDLPPYGNVQINDIVAELGALATLADGQVAVTVTEGNGRVAATLSVVDNATDDPTTVPLALTDE